MAIKGYSNVASILRTMPLFTRVKLKGLTCSNVEKGLMTKHPIRIEVIKDSHKLDPLSRLNYAKLYTIEHNVKVLFIGKVARNYERDLRHGYNEAHPPFQELGPFTPRLF